MSCAVLAGNPHPWYRVGGGIFEQELEEGEDLADCEAKEGRGGERWRGRGAWYVSTRLDGCLRFGEAVQLCACRGRLEVEQYGLPALFW
jgi:hypothetical protein